MTVPLTRTSSPRVVVGFADALSAPEAVWSISDSGFDVVVLNRRGAKPALRRSRRAMLADVVSPEQDFATSVEQTLRVARSNGGILMPLDDAAVAVSTACARADAELTIVGPTGPAAALALDKRIQLEEAAQSGFLVPPTAVVTTQKELRSAVDAFPAVLKAAEAIRVVDNRAVRGKSFVCADAAELADAEERWAEEYPLLVQPLLRGVGEGLFGLRGGGDDLLLSAHRRVRMMNPAGSGSSACTAAPVDESLVAQASHFVERTRWRGLFMLEFLRDVEGRAWFMELNGRAWGSMALARRIGLEYPAWAVRSALDTSFVPRRPPGAAPEILCRHLGREIVHVLFAVRGPATAAQKDWPKPLRALRDVVRVRRSDRWYNWRRDDWRVFVADTVGTVVDQLGLRRR